MHKGHADAKANGTLSGTAPNLAFSPAANFNRTNTFEFVASDRQAISAPVVVTEFHVSTFHTASRFVRRLGGRIWIHNSG
jgi:hypothetical protein